MLEVFSYFIPRDGDDKVTKRYRYTYANWFVENFPESEFKKEEFIFYKAVAYVTELGVSLKERYLDIFLDKEIKEIILRYRIKIVGTESLDLEDLSSLHTAIDITKNLIKTEFYKLQMMDFSIEDFITSADSFMDQRMTSRLIDVYNGGYEMINSIKNKKVGSRDALDFTQAEIEKISEIYSKDKLDELMDETDCEEEKESFRFVTDSGIPAIDKDMVALYTKQLLSIEAGPGVGKTRFTLGNWLYRTAVNYKTNVLYIALEQSKEEIEAMLIARHCYTLKGILISDKQIYTKTVPKEYKKIVEAAKYDLFKSGNYGKIRIEETELYIQKLISKINMIDKLKGPFDLIIIDNAPCIEQEEGQYTKALLDYQIIKRSYQLFKKYLKNKEKAGIMVNQFNKEGVQKSDKDVEITSDSSAGGLASQRFSDYIIAISCTKIMEAQFKRRLATPKKRSSQGIDSVVVDTRPGSCLFYQNEKSHNL